MAKIYQRCKTDKRSKNYPCNKPRCGHDWTVRYREAGGRTGRQREDSFAKKALADQFAVKIEHDKDLGALLDPRRGQIGLRSYAEAWLERQIISERTYGNQEGFLRNHLLPQLGHKTIASIRERDIAKFVADVSKKMAATTVRDRMNMVGHLFRDAVQEKVIPVNPVDGVKLPRAGSAAVNGDEIPTLAEVDLIAEHINPHYRLTVYLQAGAGLRISETLAFDSGCRRNEFIRVRWQVNAKGYRAGCKVRFIPLKHRCEGEYRDIPTAPFLEAEMAAHLADWGTASRGELMVYFTPRNGSNETMPTANTYAHHFSKALKRAGLVKADGTPKYTPHSLRHFFASTALANGIPIHEVSRWLGHKSIKTTVDIYGHLVPAAWDRCRAIMQKAMRPDSVMAPVVVAEQPGGHDAAA
ncbi:site-specific integrase [Streptomyces sp. NPDC059900]|uniref:tyrosine-type recombinase/integrase n=2 Tax=Streptomyces sp. NPDC059900 TaxID=3155816 RepID=UPI0034289B2A